MVHPLPTTVATGLVLLILIPIETKLDRPMLLASRFWPGHGWVEIALLTAYAGLLVNLLLNSSSIARWRSRYWRLFSVVFFTQLILGLLISPAFLMTGTLHLPVPAMIVAGPLFRGEGLFMPILVLSTILLAGPAWCGHLCYIGAWDDWAARHRKRAREVSARQPRRRFVILATTCVLALILRFAGVPGYLAIWVPALFGVVGIGVMVVTSRRLGVMAHCTAWCPIGALVVVLGKLSPFRLRVTDACDRCGACGTSCRFGALSNRNIEQGQAGLNCVLCGDCLSVCPHEALRVTFGRGSRDAWPVFAGIVVGLHSAFLGLARL